MPNKQRSRSRSRRKNFVAIPIEGSVALGALAHGSVELGPVLASVFTEDLYAISVDIEASITGLTAGEGEPSHLVVAHSDYSDTQVDEKLSVAFLGPGNKIEQEQSRRLVRLGGSFKSSALSSAAIKLQLEDKRIKLKFLISNGKTLNIGVVNRSGSTLTTGSSLRFIGTIYGRWIV